MSNYKFSPGPYSSGAYQISGRPFLTGSTIAGGAEVLVQFPTVTKAITVINTGAQPLRIHFDTKGSNSSVISEKHFIDLPKPATGNGLNRIKLDVRCSKIYLSSTSGTTFQLAAELTLIKDALALTGSGIN